MYFDILKTIQFVRLVHTVLTWLVAGHLETSYFLHIKNRKMHFWLIRILGLGKVLKITN